MQVVADLHLHSKYSRAVSEQMDLANMGEWAEKKGIDLLGTGDFTHPLWLRQLETSFAETNEGIYGLKNSANKKVKFVLTCEISSIYAQSGRLRRIHNILLAPNLETVQKINQELVKFGANLMSDGRPIIGMSSGQLAELVWGVNPECLIMPAHAWTPWFSLYGSKSGFDSIEECFGQFADRIWSIETGLSSDPAMNWRIKELANRSIVSFSDAHSPAKLGREATVFQSKNNDNFSFKDLTKAIKRDKKSDWEIAYTIEFYPEEGKYHYTGHRLCQVSHSPKDSQKLGTTCPVCGKPLTIGVMHRVDQLARKTIETVKKENSNGLTSIYPPTELDQPPYVMMVPLLEILAESLGFQAGSKRVVEEYQKLVSKFGSEFQILLKTKVGEIETAASPKVAQGIAKVRRGGITIKPGYDGVFGVVKIWEEEGKKEDLAKEQMSLF